MKIQSVVLFTILSCSTLNGQSIDGVYSGMFLGQKSAFSISTLNSTVIGFLWTSQSNKSSFFGTYDGAQLNGNVNKSGVDIGLSGRYFHDSLYLSFQLPVKMESTKGLTSTFIKVSSNPKYSVAKVLPKPLKVKKIPFKIDSLLVGRWILIKPSSKDRYEVEYLANGRFHIFSDRIDSLNHVAIKQGLNINLSGIPQTYSIHGSQIIRFSSINLKIASGVKTISGETTLDYEISGDTLKTVNDERGVSATFIRVKQK